VQHVLHLNLDYRQPLHQSQIAYYTTRSIFNIRALRFPNRDVSGSPWLATIEIGPGAINIISEQDVLLYNLPK
jgi:hypothetical protein